MWKDIKGYEEIYKISDTGEIWSKDRWCIDKKGRKRFRKGMKLSPDIASNGYYRITFSKNGKKVQKYLHRLIAEYFIPNPNNYPQVNHIDGNKLNCNIKNLEWVTNQDNIIHAYKNGLINHVRGINHPNYGLCGGKSKKAKKIIAKNIITGETKIYDAMIEAKKDGFLPSEISRCCNHGGTHHGYVFELI
ncbi:MAG: NUMOD4 motif-containing HNH endonuclease [Clostridium sp.]|jgi:hypothetical protein|nr:NUMOD4 motif-containing HNH endonuclease [Clostridium sp.]